MDPVEHTILDLKCPPRQHDVRRIMFRTASGRSAALRPVLANHESLMRVDAALLAQWRQLHREFFFTWWEPTVDATMTWLQQVYAPDNRDILFMVESGTGEPFGHLGFNHLDASSREMEMGRILRGAATEEPGSMTAAVAAAMGWAFTELGLASLVLEVFADNARAIALYERCGFVRAEHLLLAPHCEGDVVYWRKCEPAERANCTEHRAALSMRATPSSLLEPQGNPHEGRGEP